MARFGTLALLILAHFSGVAQMAFHAKWPTLAELADGADCFVEAVGEEELSAFEAYTEANRLIIEENWSEAEAILATMMVQAPDNRNFAYKRALCLRAIKGRIAEAVPLAMLAIQGEFEKRYNPFDVTMALPPDMALDLALEVLQFTGHFAQAQGVAKTMMDRYPERDDLHQKAKRAMADCAFSMVCVINPQRMDIRPEFGLNSVASDYAPVLSPNGQSLYFTSYRSQTVKASKRRGRIFRSLRTGSGWSKPVELDMGMPGRDMTTVSVVGDEEALLVYQSYRNEGAIWKFMKDEVGGWSRAKKVGFPVDSRHWETSMTERFDGRERVFVSDRPGGEGGRDLYRTVLLPDGTWSEPLNLGRRINTPGEEESPVLSADGRFLVFSSNGHQGMGGFDLFRCVRLDNGSWSEPKHLGSPLNTPGDEAMVSLDASGQSGFLSSKRDGGLDLDIYRVDILGEPAEALAVYLGKVNSWREGDVVEVKSIDDGPAIFRVFRARVTSGDFVAALPPCREYELSWVRRGEVLESRTEVIPCDAAYGRDREIGRLAPFGTVSETKVIPREWVGKEPRSKDEVPSDKAPVVNPAERGAEVSPIERPSHSFDRGADGEVASVEAAEEGRDASGVSSEAPKAIGFVEFDAVSATVEFGYGRYLTQSGSAEVEQMVAEILARNALGEVPVLEIEGSASFVPVKNKRAYESNEQLAKMRAQKARDAVITALSAKGLEVGIDFQIVLDWRVAGPEFKGDAISGKETYRNYQYAKFSLARQLVEKRR